MDPKAIEQEALNLPLDDRAQLAQKLLLSLDTLSEEERDDVWLTEASRRARELDRGRSPICFCRRSAAENEDATRNE